MNFRRASGLCLLFISLGMIAWSLWPFPRETRALDLGAGDYQNTLTEIRTLLIESGLANFELKISWPGKIRVGDIASIHLTLIPRDQHGSGSTTGENQFMDSETNPPLSSYPTTPLALAARLELPGIEFSPSGQTNQRLIAGEEMHFVWNIKAGKVNRYEGTAWVYLYDPDITNASEGRQVLSAQRFNFEAISFLGLDNLSTRLIASLGVAIGMVLSLDQIFIYLWNILSRKV